MNRNSFFMVAMFLAIVVFTGTAYMHGPAGMGADKKLPGQPAVKLFNGKDLNGWYTYVKDRGRNNDPKKVFTVQNGSIRISGEEWGCITTEKEYGNYRLVAEFRWGKQTYPPREDKARDSGILLHSKGEDGASGGTWMYSIECQVIEGGTGDLLVVGDRPPSFSISSPVIAEKQGSSHVFAPDGSPVTINGGRINWWGRDPDWKDVKGFRGRQDVEKAPGKWNRVECIVKDREIEVYVNKKLVNKATDVLPYKGKIQIQSEGAEIFFRRIDIIPI